MAVMQPPVQNRGGDACLAKDLGPLSTALIRGEDDGPMPIDRDGPALVEAAALGHGIEFQAFLESVLGLSLGQRRDEGQRRREERPMALLDGL